MLNSCLFNFKRKLIVYVLYHDYISIWKSIWQNGVTKEESKYEICHYSSQDQYNPELTLIIILNF